MNNIPNVFIGVDVSKDHLDAHIHPTNTCLRFANTKPGLKKMIKKLSNYDVALVACESSGGYEHLLLTMLSTACYKVWQIDPRRVKGFIVSEGIKAKTDASDAKMIALFAKEKQHLFVPKVTYEKNAQLRSLVRRKVELVGYRAKEKTKLKHPQQVFCKKEIKYFISFVDKQIEQIDKKIDSMIDDDDSWKRKKKVIESVNGIGKGTSAVLIAEMPELGTIGHKQAAALLGVAPYTNQSGNYVGAAKIREGRFLPRKALYMAALTACRSNPKIREFYDRLIAAGKKAKVALVAAMRKLCIYVNAMLRDDKLWDNCMNKLVDV